MNPFCCREEELRKLNKRYTGDWFKCIGIRKRYGLSLLYLFQGRLYGGTARGAGARRGSAGNTAGALSINQPSGMLYATAGGMFEEQ